MAGRNSTLEHVHLGSTPGDWDGGVVPSTAAACIDQLAERIADTEGGAVTYTPDDGADWNGPPATVPAALDEAASRVKVNETAITANADAVTALDSRLDSREQGQPGFADVAFAIGAEGVIGADIIAVTVTPTDHVGDAFTGKVLIELLSARLEPVAPTAFTLVVISGSSETPAAAVALGVSQLVMYPVAGSFAVRVTDIAGASGETLYIRATAPGIGIVKYSAAVTFD